MVIELEIGSFSLYTVMKSLVVVPSIKKSKRELSATAKKFFVIHLKP